MLLRELAAPFTAEATALWLWYHALYFINLEDAPPQYWHWIDSHYITMRDDPRAAKLDSGRALLKALEGQPVHGYSMNPDQVLLPWRTILQPTGPA